MSLANLIEFLTRLFGDRDEQVKFENDPEGYLEDAGFGDLTGEDVADALPLVAESFSPEWSQSVAMSSRQMGGGQYVAAGAGGPAVLTNSAAPAATTASAVEQISYINHVTEIVNEDRSVHNLDQRNIIDNSFSQSFKNDGDVKLDQELDFDNDTAIASGEGAVAAGGAIKDSQVVTGDENVTAGGDVSGVVAAGGDATRDESKVETDIDVKDSFNDNSKDDHSTTTTIEVDDSFNTDNREIIRDSNNTDVDVDVEDSFNTDNSETENTST
ncbi:MAG: IniB N-terminal domain-containing protein, partial [Actinobacteria bacterium]|nr:IniB N-terminal domain-containing protein [Actinomycetota bacterium]